MKHKKQQSQRFDRTFEPDTRDLFKLTLEIADGEIGSKKIIDTLSLKTVDVSEGIHRLKQKAMDVVRQESEKYKNGKSSVEIIEVSMTIQNLDKSSNLFKVSTLYSTLEESLKIIGQSSFWNKERVHILP